MFYIIKFLLQTTTAEVIIPINNASAPNPAMLAKAFSINAMSFGSVPTIPLKSREGRGASCYFLSLHYSSSSVTHY